MDISNGSGGIDSSKLMDYFTKDFLTDLGKMAVLRDELEKRQGSMNAVNAANAKVTEADAYAESTKAQVDALLADAKIKNTDANARQGTLDAREKDLAELQKQSLASAAAAAKDEEAKAVPMKPAQLTKKVVAHE